mmetsp:Transcript_10510/g.32334  ORF Transcript_10510/g.32334 Transcript_10510/m.32334 type:complete len:101 (+) Transcript_10510:111-413(+)
MFKPTLLGACGKLKLSEGRSVSQKRLRIIIVRGEDGAKALLDMLEGFHLAGGFERSNQDAHGLEHTTETQPSCFATLTTGITTDGVADTTVACTTGMSST